MLDWKKWLDQQENPLTGDELKAQVIDILRTIRDPEIPVNIYDLGLIYTLEITPQSEVRIRMTEAARLQLGML